MSYRPDTELTGLLGELSQQAERTLFSVGGYARKLDEPVSVRMPSLSNLEREILQSYREETAYLLKYLSYILGFTERTAFFRIGNPYSSKEVQEAERNAWQDRTQHLLRSQLSLPSDVRSMLVEGMGGSCTVERAARASQQFEDSGYANLQIANARILRADSRNALKHSKIAVSSVVKDSHLGTAQLALGLSLMLEGEHELAWSRVFFPFKTCERSLPMLLRFGFLAALRTSDAKAIDIAKSRLEEVVLPMNKGLAEFCTALQKPGSGHHSLASGILPRVNLRNTGSGAASVIMDTIRQAPQLDQPQVGSGPVAAPLAGERAGAY